METAAVLLIVAAALAYVVKRLHGQLSGRSRCALGRGGCARVAPECKGQDGDCNEA